MRAPAILLATLLGLACGACRGVETAQGPGFVLTSPFRRDGTDAWRTRVQREVTDVATFLGKEPPDPPVEIRLEALDVPADADILAQLTPSADGLLGWEIGGREVHVFVPQAHDGMFTITADGVLRHELSHMFLHRMDVGAPSWFDEGLAHEIEDAVRTRDGLRLQPAPLQLVVARAHASTTDLAQLWAWDGSHRVTQDEESAFRIVARSFVRFLIERDGEQWTLHLRRLAATRPADDPALVHEWRKWLDGIGFARRVERGAVDPDPDVRAAAANALPCLAECARQSAGHVPGIADAVDERTDAAACVLAASTDPAVAESAGRYLVYFRFHAVDVMPIQTLFADDAQPWTRLIGLAVFKRSAGGEPVQAQALWDALPAFERMRFVWLRSFLPLRN